MVDRIAEAGFGAGAYAYEAARPGYPDEVFALLANDLGLGPHSDVCDLAAGTGKFTAGLVGLGARVLADVRDLIDRHPQTSGRDRFVFPHRTDLFWCRVGTG